MPQKADYEARVLRSAVLSPNELLFKVVYDLNEFDFSNDAWRSIYRKLKELAGAKVSSTISLMDGLSDAGLFPEALLESWSSIYTLDSIDEPIKTIKNRSRLIRLKSMYEQSIKVVEKLDTDSEKHITSTITSLADIYGGGGEKDVASMVDELVENSKNYVGRTLFGVPYNIPLFDNITKGMQPGHLWLLGGYTSMGKSWFAIRALLEFIRANSPALYLSFEMGAEEILWRLAVMDMEESGVSIFKAKTRIGLTHEESNSLGSEFQLLKQYPLSICDSLFSMDEVKLKILHDIKSSGTKCIVVDYIQNIMVPKASGEYESLNRIVLELQTLARQNRVFILALSQVNRESQKTGNSTVFGFKGSGNIENAADIAITINPVEGMLNQRNLVVGKNREGMTGSVICDVDFSRGAIEQCKLQE